MSIRTAKRSRQVHLWLTEGEYEWLMSEAEASDDTISAVIRRILRVYRSNAVISSHQASRPVTPSSQVHKK
jgi:hypothetical protein